MLKAGGQFGDYNLKMCVSLTQVLPAAKTYAQTSDEWPAAGPVQHHGTHSEDAQDGVPESYIAARPINAERGDPSVIGMHWSDANTARIRTVVTNTPIVRLGTLFINWEERTNRSSGNSTRLAGKALEIDLKSHLAIILSVAVDRGGDSSRGHRLSPSVTLRVGVITPA